MNPAATILATGRPQRLTPAVLSADWTGVDADLYLRRCQIDTPASLVDATWQRALTRRPRFRKVVDFGAGDGRFAATGQYDSYVGYEIDLSRAPIAPLPPFARIEHACAFSARVQDADLCIGNPPFVRNQDLPLGWRTRVASELVERSGVALSGLANAWQYFFLLSLLSTGDDGVCALVVPYEWVSRPSVAPLRRYIRERGWDVQVYRLTAEPFESVLTTASITIIDKGGTSGRWSYFVTGSDGVDLPISTETGGDEGLVAYTRVARTGSAPRAVRGLSPGTQRVLTLTEGERARLGLSPGRDVVRCITTLRTLSAGVADLDLATFESVYRNAGRRCWLIVPETAAGDGPLAEYLDSVDPAEYATRTCLDRDRWWEFKMPDAPDALVATCFKGNAPKAVLNGAGAIAVGGVAGVHGAGREGAAAFLARLGQTDLRKRIVAHANKLFKLEIGQLNTLLSEVPNG